jgi:hypothetical protein
MALLPAYKSCPQCEELISKKMLQSHIGNPKCVEDKYKKTSFIYSLNGQIVTLK